MHSDMSPESNSIEETMQSKENIPTEILDLFYFQTVDLWRKLCEEHQTLFDITCEEYSHLLSNNLDELEKTISQKQITIHSISGLEEIRKEVISDINQYLSSENITNVSGLLKLMSNCREEKESQHLWRFNKLLIDIIEKVQEQNKRNQLFINKALLSLREIRQEMMGNKKYMTYNQQGAPSLR